MLRLLIPLCLLLGLARAEADVRSCPRSADTLVAEGFAAAAEAGLAHLHAVMDEHRVPGMSVAIWSDGPRPLWSTAAGYENLESSVCADRATVFPLGSVSKLFAATAAALLAQRSELDLDADIHQLVEQYPAEHAVITPRQLLGHLAGIRHYTGKDYDFSQPGSIIDLRLYRDTADALAIFVNDPLVAAPGTTYSYSTFGYTLLAAAMEHASGASFLDLIEREIANPLGLSSLRGDELRATIPDRAGRYEINREGELVRAFPANVAYKWAGGGLVATADDLARFGIAHVEPGLLTPQMHRTVFTPQQTTDGESIIVGLGWRIGVDAADRPIYHHAGSIGGGRAQLVVWPDQQLSVAVMSNLSNTPGDIMTVAQTLAQPFLLRTQPAE